MTLKRHKIIELLTSLTATFIIVVILSGCESVHELSILCKNETGRVIPDVQISIDGVTQGETDIEGSIALTITPPENRTVNIKVEHNEFFPATKEVKLSEGKKSEFTIVMLPRRNIEIKCMGFEEDAPEENKPLEGATIIINGEEAGKTNDQGLYRKEIKAKLNEQFFVSAYKEGYVLETPAPVRMTVVSGKRDLEKTLLFRLIPQIKPMEVTVKAFTGPDEQPVEGVEATKNGESLGKTDKTGILRFELTETEGIDIKLEFKKPGWTLNPSETTVTMEETTAKTIKIKAQEGKPSQAPGAATEPAPVTVPEPPVYGITAIVEVVITEDSTLNRDRWTQIILRDFQDHIDPIAYLRYAETTDLNVAEQWSPRATGALYALLFKVTGGETNNIEMSLYNYRGQPQFRHTVEDINPDDLHERLQEGFGAVTYHFPVEGFVVSVEGGSAALNIGKDRNVKPGDTFADKYHRTLVRINEVSETQSKGAVTKGNPWRSQKLRRREIFPEMLETTAAVLNIKDQETGEPLSSAVVYRDGSYVGTTDERGQLDLLVPQSRPYELEVMKLGWTGWKEVLNHEEQIEREIELKRDYCMLTLKTVPDGSQVYINDEYAGKTPLETEVRLGLYKFKFVPADRDKFRTITTREPVSIIDQKETLEFVHQGDYYEKARELEQIQNYREAVEMYARVNTPASPLQSETFINARFSMGLICLDKLKDHPCAVKAFRAVLNWDDKYALAYLNLGLAYYMENRWLSAAEQFSKALRFKRFIPDDRYTQAVHDILFYSAMCNQKLYFQSSGTQKEKNRLQACSAWMEYFDFYNDIKPGDKSMFADMVGPAQSYKAKVCK